jgi:hypothetical protein
MSLEDLGNIGEFVAAVAVVVSLVYLAWQIRQNTEWTRRSTYGSMKQDIQNFRAMVVQDSDVARLHRDGLKDLHSLDEYERWRFGALMQHLFSHLEDLFRFRGDATFDYRDEEIRWMAGQPGAREWWKVAKRLYHPEFQSYIDTLLEEEGEAGEANDQPAA